MALRPDTQSVWERLRRETALTGFVLVGGSALAIHFGHRVSEDLDFAFMGLGAAPPLCLPRNLLDRLLTLLRSEGRTIESQDSAVSWQEFESAGMDLHDYQQDYSIGGVKVSFFTPGRSLGRLLGPGKQGEVRLASADELFRSKALIVADRSKARDWFDLYHLLTEGKYTMEAFAGVFEEAGEPSKLGIALNRLSSGQPGLGDEGFAALLPQAPTVEQLARFFAAECSQLEVTLSKRAFQRRQAGNESVP